MGKYGSWDEIDKRTDLDEYTKKELKMDEYLYLDAERATTCLMFPSVSQFRESIKENYKDQYPSVVAFLNDKFWDQVVPETTANNDKIMDRIKELVKKGEDPDSWDFPQLEGESLLEVMLTLFGTYFLDKLIDSYLINGIDTYEEQTDQSKQPIASKIRSKTNK